MSAEPVDRSSGRVILGFDPIHPAPEVIAFGSELAEALGAEPDVVTVLPWPPGFLDRFPKLRAQLESDLADQFAEAREQSGADITPRALPGPSPAATLHELALEEEARAIVIGSAHGGAAERALAGSVGESLMHGAPCAVAIVPRGYAAEGDSLAHEIAVAFDGAAESRGALETAVALTQAWSGRLTVLCVADPPRYAYGSGWPPMLYEELERAERDRIQEALDGALGRLPAGLEHRGVILTGSAARSLADVSADYDLMVTGSRAYGPVRRTLLGSTTRTLIHSAACPVLVLPRGGSPIGLPGNPS